MGDYQDLKSLKACFGGWTSSIDEGVARVERGGWSFSAPIRRGEIGWSEGFQPLVDKVFASLPVSTVLIEAAGLIEHQESYNGFCLAQDKSGKEVPAYSLKAVRWCPMAAIQRVLGVGLSVAGLHPAFMLLHKSVVDKGFSDIVDWNVNTPHHEVISHMRLLALTDVDIPLSA